MTDPRPQPTPARPGRRRALVIAGAVAAIALAAGAAVVATRARAAARPAAPAFAVRSLDGAELSLAGLRGKVVLIDFWATWCEPCQRELPHLVELQRRLGPLGLQIIGVSMDDDPAEVRRFVARLHVDYPIAMGDQALGRRFGGIMGLPAKFLIDRRGGLAGTRVGPVELAWLDDTLAALLDE